MTDEMQPVSIHVASIAKGVQLVAAPSKKRRAVTTRSYILNSTDPVQEILHQSDKRVEAFLTFATNDLTIAKSKADALNGGNGAAVLPHVDAVPFPLNTTDAMWAAATVLPTTVSVVAIYEQDDV